MKFFTFYLFLGQNNCPNSTLEFENIKKFYFSFVCAVLKHISVRHFVSISFVVAFVSSISVGIHQFCYIFRFCNFDRVLSDFLNLFKGGIKV